MANRNANLWSPPSEKELLLGGVHACEEQVGVRHTDRFRHALGLALVEVTVPATGDSHLGVMLGDMLPDLREHRVGRTKQIDRVCVPVCQR